MAILRILILVLGISVVSVLLVALFLVFQSHVIFKLYRGLTLYMSPISESIAILLVFGTLFFLVKYTQHSKNGR